MSASRLIADCPSFDHLVGSGEQRRNQNCLGWKEAGARHDGVANKSAGYVVFAVEQIRSMARDDIIRKRS
jgi:hypothetical protein